MDVGVLLITGVLHTAFFQMFHEAIIHFVPGTTDLTIYLDISPLKFWMRNPAVWMS